LVKAIEKGGPLATAFKQKQFYKEHVVSWSQLSLFTDTDLFNFFLHDCHQNIIMWNTIRKSLNLLDLLLGSGL